MMDWELSADMGPILMSVLHAAWPRFADEAQALHVGHAIARACLLSMLNPASTPFATRPHLSAAQTTQYHNAASSRAQLRLCQL
jgi:hypothetical protein